MNARGTFSVIALTIAVAGCGPQEKVSFNAGPQQQAMVRDGRNVIVSRRKNSTVMISPASREIATGHRPIFVVGIQNTGKIPQDFRVAGVAVSQLQAGAPSRPIAVVAHDQLVREERTRQVVSAILVGAAAVGNSYSAQQASYTSSGRYSPLAGAINGARADAQNAALIGDTVAAGQMNLDALEKNVIKDNTVMPAEWVGGQLHMEAPQGDGRTLKTYVISIPVGDEVHEVTVSQGQGA